jgi:hypothetical protein
MYLLNPLKPVCRVNNMGDFILYVTNNFVFSVTSVGQ